MEISTAAENAFPITGNDIDYRRVFTSLSGYGIILLDLRGLVLSWNRGAEEITGYQDHQILGKSFEQLYLPLQQEQNIPESDLELAQSQGRLEGEGWRQRKDGSHFWAHFTITALKDETGRLQGYCKVTRDVTDKKMAEDALKNAYDELESFTYSVSHDLRAPLRSMDGFSEIIQRNLKDKLDAKTASYLRRIQESSQRMAQLIDDILNLSRMGRSRIQRERVDLSLTAMRIFENQLKNAPDRKVQFSVQSGIEVMADPGLMQVVLENLIGNALKYTSQKDNAKIEVGGTLEQDPASLQKHRIVWIRDNGAGFDMKYGEKLFGAFQRLHGAREFPGMGIGLATVRRIIQRHGGRIWADSKVDEGAIFSFTVGPASESI